MTRSWRRALALVLALGLGACVDLTRPPLPDAGPPPPPDAADTDGGVDAPPAEDAADATPDVPNPPDAAPDARDAGADMGVDTGVDVPQPSTLSMGLIGYWTLDAITGSKALDSTTNHNDAFVEGLPTVVNGPSAIMFQNGGAYAFRGLDDAAWVPPADALTPSKLSLAAWVRFDSLTSRGKCGGVNDTLQYIVFRRNPAAGNGIAEGVALFKQADQHFAFMLRDGNGVADTATSTTVAQTNRWIHLVATYDGSNGQMRLYVNGVAEDGASHPQGVSFDPAGRLWMARSGECRDDGIGVTNFDGKLAGILDDVRLYGRVLSAAEVSALAMGRN